MALKQGLGLKSYSSNIVLKENLGNWAYIWKSIFFNKMNFKIVIFLEDVCLKEFLWYWPTIHLTFYSKKKKSTSP